MSVDVIGDFLTIIRNGVLSSKTFVIAPYSKIKEEIARILKEEGFIRDVVLESDESGKQNIKVLLKYVDGESVIHQIKRVSTPGRRRYSKIGNVEPVIGNLGISVMSTNKGIMTNKRAKSLSVGGEILCSVW